MKVKDLKLDDFNILEMLTNGVKGTYSLHSETPIISIAGTVTGVGKKAIEYLRAKVDDRVVLLEKQGVWYIAILPFDSKIKGYKVSMTSKKNNSLFIFNCRAKERGLSVGYYKLLPPIYVGGIDLFELEPFDINN